MATAVIDARCPGCGRDWQVVCDPGKPMAQAAIEGPCQRCRFKAEIPTEPPPGMLSHVTLICEWEAMDPTVPGVYTVRCPEIPGLVAEGRTVSSALNNAAAAHRILASKDKTGGAP